MKIVEVRYMKAVEEKPAKRKKQVVRPRAKRSKPVDKLRAMIDYRNSQV